MFEDEEREEERSTHEIVMTAEDYGIDSKRLQELDEKMIDHVYIAVGSEEEMHEKKDEAEKKGTDRLKEIYEILQDYNQLEIAFFIIHMVGATIQPDVLKMHNHQRMMHFAKKGMETRDPKYMGLARKIALDNMKGFLGGLMGGLF